jgi:poly(A) polymerase
MKLRELLDLIENVARRIQIPNVWICGGIARSKAIGNISDVSDLDITTCSNKIFNLAKEVEIELKKSFSIKARKLDDGHTSITIGDFKLDFSSNFVDPNIDNILHQKNIIHPNDIQREMFSRDFTCNALLLSFDLKTILDPTEQGLSDIKNKIIRTCLNPSITFNDNVNRIVRVIYLSSKLNFQVDEAIIDFISKHKNLIHLSPERYVLKNIEKAMKYNKTNTINLINKLELNNDLPIKVAGRNFDYDWENYLDKIAPIKRENIKKRIKKLKSLLKGRK